MYSLSDVCINIMENILRNNGGIHLEVLLRSDLVQRENRKMWFEQDLCNSGKKCTVNTKNQILPGLSVLPWEWYLTVKNIFFSYSLLDKDIEGVSSPVLVIDASACELMSRRTGGRKKCSIVMCWCSGLSTMKPQDVCVYQKLYMLYIFIYIYRFLFCLPDIFNVTDCSAHFHISSRSEKKGQKDSLFDLRDLYIDTKQDGRCL